MNFTTPSQAELQARFFTEINLHIKDLEVQRDYLQMSLLRARAGAPQRPVPLPGLAFWVEPFEVAAYDEASLELQVADVTQRLQFLYYVHDDEFFVDDWDEPTAVAG